ncbi:MAG: hypothetical protein OXD40_15420 [bacterium]|nr:hypothetical protein [bacterium]
MKLRLLLAVSLIVLAMPVWADPCDRAKQRFEANDRAYAQIVGRMEAIAERYQRDRDDFVNNPPTDAAVMQVLEATLKAIAGVFEDIIQSRNDLQAIISSDFQSCYEATR